MAIIINDKKIITTNGSFDITNLANIDHPVINLDLATRTFDGPKDYVVAIVGDSNSQMIEFKTPSVYDGIDLYGTFCILTYWTSWVDDKGRNSKGYVILDGVYNEETKDITYTWLLDLAQTARAGTCKFTLTFYLPLDEMFYYNYTNQMKLNDNVEIVQDSNGVWSIIVSPITEEININYNEILILDLLVDSGIYTLTRIDENILDDNIKNYTLIFSEDKIVFLITMSQEDFAKLGFMVGNNYKITCDSKSLKIEKIERILGTDSNGDGKIDVLDYPYYSLSSNSGQFPIIDPGMGEGGPLYIEGSIVTQILDDIENLKVEANELKIKADELAEIEDRLNQQIQDDIVQIDQKIAIIDQKYADFIEWYNTNAESLKTQLEIKSFDTSEEATE